MLITESHSHEILLIQLDGRLDSSGAPELHHCLEVAIGRGDTRMVLDFGKVPYVNSKGIRTLMTCTKHLQAAGGRACISGLSDELSRFFTMSGLSTIYPLYPDTETALLALSKS